MMLLLALLTWYIFGFQLLRIQEIFDKKANDGYGYVPYTRLMYFGYSFFGVLIIYKVCETIIDNPGTFEFSNWLNNPMFKKK